MSWRCYVHSGRAEAGGAGRAAGTSNEACGLGDWGEAFGRGGEIDFALAKVSLEVVERDRGVLPQRVCEGVTKVATERRRQRKKRGRRGQFKGVGSASLAEPNPPHKHAWRLRAPAL